MYPDSEVIKSHTLGATREEHGDSAKIISSIRDPRDSIASYIQAHKLEPSEAVVRGLIDVFNEQGMSEVIDIYKNPNVLLLKYEEFAFDLDYLFDQISQFLGEIENTEQMKISIGKQFSIEKMEAKSKALGDFVNYDEADHIHGRHISKYKGQCGYYKSFLTPDLIEHN